MRARGADEGKGGRRGQGGQMRARGADEGKGGTTKAVRHNLQCVHGVSSMTHS